MPSPRLAELEKLQARQEAILSGMQDQRAMYPSQEELGRARGSLGLDEPGSKAAFQDVSSNQYEYKPEHQGKPGTAPGTQEGPMAHELRPLGVTEFGPDGMERVDTDRLSMKNASATGELARADDEKQAEIERLNARVDALLESIRGGDAENDPDRLLGLARGE